MLQAFPATKNNSVEIAYISKKNLRYTFDTDWLSKLMEEYWFLDPMLRLAISSASLNFLFLKPSTTIFPMHGPSN